MPSRVRAQSIASKTTDGDGGVYFFFYGVEDNSSLWTFMTAFKSQKMLFSFCYLQLPFFFYFIEQSQMRFSTFSKLRLFYFFFLSQSYLIVYLINDQVKFWRLIQILSPKDSVSEFPCRSRRRRSRRMRWRWRRRRNKNIPQKFLSTVGS